MINSIRTFLAYILLMLLSNLVLAALLSASIAVKVEQNITIKMALTFVSPPPWDSLAGTVSYGKDVWRLERYLRRKDPRFFLLSEMLKHFLKL